MDKNMAKGISIKESLKRYHASGGPSAEPEEQVIQELLQNYHPDYDDASMVTLQVGPNRGERCHRQLASLLQADAMIDEADLAGAPVYETDILVIGGGGAGCAAALVAAQKGAKVVLATKLRLGDSNTLMAEGGIQASVEKDDSPQLHFNDTLKAGHECADKQLVKTLASEAPETIRWLIQQGMQFDEDQFGDLLTRKAGGTSANRVVYYRDYTGLEMMRALREGVLNYRVDVWEYNPVVELLTNESGHCAGAVVMSLNQRSYTIVKAQAIIVATGGIGRLHLNGFPTSNHLGAMADGLVLAYRIGALLRNLDSFQYHPTGMAYPKHMSGSLITEGIRSAGARLLNGLGERFIEELKPRDCVTAAILRECAEGRGVVDKNDVLGVWLDVPQLEKENPGILEQRFPKLLLKGKMCELDPKKDPLLIYPTLHYQNGGAVIDNDGETTIPGLYCVGEVSGGIHGRNRLMGNALLEIICFGRRAGDKASEMIHGRGHKKVTLEHLSRLRRELTHAGLPLELKTPALFPDYAFQGGEL
jgi:succinate dehydrogenase / fumarate reductase flavoprotein subunit/L-aspartate oxidase